MNLNHLPAYFEYSQAIRKSMNSNNTIERMDMKIRRSIKSIDSF
ncbi:transposase [Thermoplasma sp. Kam2015]